jgi:hypothetical protein
MKWFDKPFGERIDAFIEDENGAILCPVDGLEMCVDQGRFYCGSGHFGDGHWIPESQILSGD